MDEDIIPGPSDPATSEDDVSPEQLELFVVMDAAATKFPIKDDVSSMEFPVYSLTKKADKTTRIYNRGGHQIRVIPSSVGSATIYDKDVIVYALSQIVQGKSNGLPVSRRIKIKSHPFLKATKRGTGGMAYQRIIDMCRRLRGTTIETNVRTTEEERTKGFGLIEDYTVTKKTKNGDGALEFEIVISEWLFRAADELKVLTVHAGYFKLSAIERRIYELARKHASDKAYWKCGLDLFYKKVGSFQDLKYFRRDLVDCSANDKIPDYHVVLDEAGREPQVVFFSKDSRRVIKELKAQNLLPWYMGLMQQRISLNSKRDANKR